MACQRGLSYGLYSYKTIQTILENKMDNYEESIFADELPMPDHGNIREKTITNNHLKQQ
ncbi:hypothetical protein [Mucilaginibacter rubeus]|nr:hypothetical protein [Mucilaginibacter rubeus]